MPFTIVAFSESIDAGGALTNVAGVTDDTHRVSGDFIYVGSLNNIIGVVAFTGSTGSRAQLQAPSLRRNVLLDISPVVQGLAGADQDQIHLFPASPLPLATNEGLEALSLADPAAAEQVSVVVFLYDGAIAPVSGEIYTVRATASITASTGDWVSGNLTFGQTLPVGRYQLVGARVEGANLVAARFIFVGEVQRAGVIPVADAADREHPLFRKGGLGVWGEFDSTTPPSLEILASGSNTSQVVYLDLIKIA